MEEFLRNSFKAKSIYVFAGSLDFAYHLGFPTTQLLGCLITKPLNWSTA
jgi:hypothetical protein